MQSNIVGYFRIRASDSIKFPICKNNIISQTYIANFKQYAKIIINLPSHLRLSKTIDIQLDNNLEYTKFENRLKTETNPAYLFINATKYTNNGIIGLTWSEINS